MLLQPFIHIVSRPLAYIDPSSGGLLFQILAAVFVALSGLVLFFSSQIKMGFARLLRWLRREPKDHDPQRK